MTDLIKILNNPEEHYPGNFDTPQRANAVLTGLCQDAAKEIAKLQAEVLEQCRINGMSAEREDALRAELTRLKASIALDKMAENARELGLDYEPAVHEGRDWSLLAATQESLREHMAEIKRLKAAQPAPVQDLPFGVGGGLVAIKTLLSRELCIHANTAIGMIDAILKEHPAAQPAVQEPDELKHIGEQDSLLDVDERAWHLLVENRGGCRCHISPPCGACSNPISEEEMNEVGYTYNTPPAAQPAAHEPWKHDCAALLQNDIELWVDRCPHCGKPRTTTPAQPAPKIEGVKLMQMLGALVQKYSDQLYDGKGAKAANDFELDVAAIRLTVEAQSAPVQPVALPLRETEEMHDAVMSVIYQGVSRTNTDALWQAYRKVLTTTPPAAQPAVQEPVAWVNHGENRITRATGWDGYGPLYTTPPAPQPVPVKTYHDGKPWPVAPKPWVGLTDAEIDLFINGRGDADDDNYVEPTGDGFGLTDADLLTLVRRAEAKLKEKNHV